MAGGDRRRCGHGRFLNDGRRRRGCRGDDFFNRLEHEIVVGCVCRFGFGVLRAAAERNIRVPSELSVIGFDDIQMGRYVYPALTTVGQSILQLGEMAAGVLLRAAYGPREAVSARKLMSRQISAVGQSCSTMFMRARALVALSISWP
mgnify:CR=1 FL=1